MDVHDKIRPPTKTALSARPPYKDCERGSPLPSAPRPVQATLGRVWPRRLLQRVDEITRSDLEGLFGGHLRAYVGALFGSVGAGCTGVFAPGGVVCDGWMIARSDRERAPWSGCRLGRSSSMSSSRFHPPIVPAWPTGSSPRLGPGLDPRPRGVPTRPVSGTPHAVGRCLDDGIPRPTPMTRRPHVPTVCVDRTRACPVSPLSPPSPPLRLSAIAAAAWVVRPHPPPYPHTPPVPERPWRGALYAPRCTGHVVLACRSVRSREPIEHSAPARRTAAVTRTPGTARHGTASRHRRQHVQRGRGGADPTPGVTLSPSDRRSAGVTVYVDAAHADHVGVRIWQTRPPHGFFNSHFIFPYEYIHIYIHIEGRRASFRSAYDQDRDGVR